MKKRRSSNPLPSPSHATNSIIMDFFDPTGEPLVTPKELVKNLTRRRVGAKALEVPACALFAVSRHDLKAFVRILQGELMAPWQRYREVYRGYAGEKRMTIALTPPGAPNCVALAEELAAFGMKRLLFFGYCGSLQPGARAGDIISPTGAIREEGTSFHYLPADAAAEPDREIQGVVVDCLHRTKVPFHQGTVWSTDAIYRETKGKVKHYQEAGVLGVEMELAALFAFGQAQQVAVGGLLIVTDELSAESWRPRFFSPRLIYGVRRARKAVVEIVQEMARVPS